MRIPSDRPTIREGKNDFRYDRVLKDLFQKDRPSLLDQLAGGLRVRAFLNVEFPKVIERRADLAVLLEDDSILHIEFQSHNDKEIAYREGMYCLMIAQKYRRQVRQVVLYVGQPKMRMADRLDLGGTKVSYRLLDIREIDAAELLRISRPADLALALLARGGIERRKDIARRIISLGGAERGDLLTKMFLLAGLRPLTGSLKMELENMTFEGLNIEKHPILGNLFREWRIKARSEGMAEMLREQLQSKFGPLPRWAQERLSQASQAQVGRWARKILVADTLERVLGKK